VSPERPASEVVRSLVADSAADMAEVLHVRRSLRQWDRGCFRAQQAALKVLRALRVAWGDAPSSAPLLVADEAAAIGGRAPEIAALAAAARGLDRFFVATGLPLGVPQIHGEADCASAEAAASEIRDAALDRLRAAGFAERG